jgi:drug/metabolite transporter (DMT)-like permease
MSESAPRSASASARLGIALMILATFLFGSQDALSRHLAQHYDISVILAIRFWFFAAVVTLLGVRAEGGLGAVIVSRRPLLQIARGVCLIVQLSLLLIGFVALGLVESHALFAIYPLLVVALAGPLLKEVVTPRQWFAVLVGIAGVLVILRPGVDVFSWPALYVLAAAALFAAYSLMTRLVSRSDPAATTFFYTGWVAAILLAPPAISNWVPLAEADWGWMALLCLSGTAGHYLLIHVYALVEASRVQPLAYLQLVFASLYGVLLFGDAIAWLTVLGAALVIAGGLLAISAARAAAK